MSRLHKQNASCIPFFKGLWILLWFLKCKFLDNHFWICDSFGHSACSQSREAKSTTTLIEGMLSSPPLFLFFLFLNKKAVSDWRRLGLSDLGPESCSKLGRPERCESPKSRRPLGFGTQEGKEAHSRRMWPWEMWSALLRLSQNRCKMSENAHILKASLAVWGKTRFCSRLGDLKRLQQTEM